MILAGMYFALGVLVTGLVAVAIMPAIWRRALRLTRARAEASVPLSRAEISADRDRLRATFASTNRKLELQADRLRQQVAERVVEVNRERDVSSALRGDNAALSETIADLEGRLGETSERLESTEKTLEGARAEIEARKNTLSEREKAYAELAQKLAEAQQLTEAQRLEQVALNTEIGNLRDEIAKAEARIREGAEETAALRASLAAEAMKIEQAHASAGAMQAQIDTTRLARDGALAKAERAAGLALAAQMEAVERGARLAVVETALTAARAAAASAHETARETESLRSSTVARADRAAGLALAAQMESVARGARMAELEQSLAEARASRDHVAAELALVSSDRALRTEEAERHAADLATIRRDLADERRRAEEAATAGSDAEATLASLRDELDAANDDRIDMLTTVDEQRAALDRSQSERDAARSRIGELESVAEHHGRELESLRTDLETRDAEIARLQESLAESDDRYRDAMARVEEESQARADARSELRDRQIEIDALNAEMQVLATGLEPDASAASGIQSGDNIRKSLAAAEKTNARLAEQITALEREARALRLENDRLRQQSTGDRETADVSRKLERVGDAVTRLSDVGETAEAPAIERAPRAGGR